jgi:hypothetical protein
LLTDESVHALSLKQCDRVLKKQWLSDEVCTVLSQYNDDSGVHSPDSTVLFESCMQGSKKGIEQTVCE